jgi:hypothetical protein
MNFNVFHYLKLRFSFYIYVRYLIASHIPVNPSPPILLLLKSFN